MNKGLGVDDLFGSVVVSRVFLLLLGPCRNLLVFPEVPGILLGCTVDGINPGERHSATTLSRSRTV